MAGKTFTKKIPLSKRVAKKNSGKKDKQVGKSDIEKDIEHNEYLASKGWTEEEITQWHKDQSVPERFVTPDTYDARKASPTVKIYEGGKGEKEEMVNHPSHYGGADNPYEVIKVIEAYPRIIGDFNKGNAVKYLLRAGEKVITGNTPEEQEIEDLKKAVWYINRRISFIQTNHIDEFVETTIHD